jgi:hypothetical protein
MNPCRVRIVNDITGHTTTVETRRDRGAGHFGLANVVRYVTRQRGHAMKASLHMMADQLVLHVHCPSCCGDSTDRPTNVAGTMRQVEEIIWAKDR